MSLVRRLISSPAGLRSKKAIGRRLQVREQVPAHLLERALRDAGHHPVGDGLEQVVQQIDGQHPQRDRGQPGDLLGGDETGRWPRPSGTGRPAPARCRSEPRPRRSVMPVLKGSEVSAAGASAPGAGLWPFRSCRGRPAAWAASSRGHCWLRSWIGSSFRHAPCSSLATGSFRMEAVPQLRIVDFLVDRAGLHQLRVRALRRRSGPCRSR